MSRRPRTSRRIAALAAVLLLAGVATGRWLFGPGDGAGGSGTSAAAPGRPAANSTVFPVGVGNADLSGRVQPHGNGSPSPVPLNLDGCDRNYEDPAGLLRVCVPVVMPGGGPVDCAGLRQLGIGPLVVVGTDALNLAVSGVPAAPGDLVCGG